MDDERLEICVSGKGQMVDVETFVGALNGFHHMLQTLESDPTKKIKWGICDLRIGSAVAVLQPSGPHDAALGMARRVADGIALMEETSLPPDDFPLETIRAMKGVIDLAKRAKAKVTVSSRERRLELSDRTAEAVRTVLEVATWQENGSITGALYMVNLYGGMMKCGIQDEMSGERIACTFREQELDDVKIALGCRVSASGLLRFNRRNEMISIHVDELRRLPSDKDLPSIDEMIGLAPDITGPWTTNEYLRRLRDEQ